ncbi:hypothetical protein K443DRAFT_678564 [Laccaria amethystina LaAM-08-1]|uniref:Uncharacterized protein n=1 Tax=Laccaria amethystina LaAM-08-1 TaxID=1095629 RepID=A0A0C9XI44_9AGAR|nr:hypothetical protein K443DRAFT_678564 [Laccaria amethystina LaAM-08-1]
MMLAKLLIVVAGCLCAVVASAVVQRDGFRPLNPPVNILDSRDTPSYKSLNPPLNILDSRDAPSPTLVRKTNAERLIAGLPLNPPRRSRTAHPRGVPSGVPTLTQGYIKVTEAGTGKDYGFLNKDLNNFGEFQTTSDPGQRAIFSINLADAAQGQTNIAVNGASARPYIGGIVGFSSALSDLKSGFATYSYIGQTEASPLNSPPVMVGNTFSDATGLAKGVESAIWVYDAGSGTITPQWVNNNLSLPATYIGLSQGLLILSGDKYSFSTVFGPTTWLTFTFIPI